MLESEDQQDRLNFEIDNNYQDQYLDENYEPERYNIMKNLLSGITKSFDDFLDEHKKYHYLRSIDISKVGINDRIMIIEPCCTGIIINISEDTCIVQVNGSMMETSTTNIKPVDEYINKLKIADISLLYEYIRNKADSRTYDEIEYFFVFSEYFKINEKTLYNAMSTETQSILLNELNKRVGLFGKKKVEAMF
jgi:hypothetical protein